MNVAKYAALRKVKVTPLNVTGAFNCPVWATVKERDVAWMMRAMDTTGSVKKNFPAVPPAGKPVTHDPDDPISRMKPGSKALMVYRAVEAHPGNTCTDLHQRICKDIPDRKNVSGSLATLRSRGVIESRGQRKCQVWCVKGYLSNERASGYPAGREEQQRAKQ